MRNWYESKSHRERRDLADTVILLGGLCAVAVLLALEAMGWLS
jgi:hypothetical protein